MILKCKVSTLIHIQYPLTSICLKVESANLPRVAYHIYRNPIWYNFLQNSS